MTDHTAALRDGIRILAYRLQNAAYNNGNIDAGEWSDKKYSDAADKSDAARDALMAAVDAALAQPQQPAGWRPIETAPKDGPIWVFNGEQGVMHWTEGECYALWVWTDDVLSDVDPSPDQPTHWMPLPPAPTAHPSQQEDATMTAQGQEQGGGKNG